MLGPPVRFTVIFSSDRRFSTLSGETVTFSVGERLTGVLRIESWLGPLEVQEYDHPSYFKTLFDFERAGEAWRCQGFQSVFTLWARDGEHATEEWPSFVNHAGPIQCLHDTRENTTYVLPGVLRRTVRVKNMDCRFELMVRAADVVVACRHYDASEFADYRCVYYTRPAETIAFSPTYRLHRNQMGEIEDWDTLHPDVIDLVRRDA